MHASSNCLDRLVRREIERRGENAGDDVGDEAAPACEERGGLASENEIAGAELVVHVRLEARELLHIAVEQEQLSDVELVDEAVERLLRDAVVDGFRKHVLLTEERACGAREDTLARVARHVRELPIDGARSVARRRGRRRRCDPRVRGAGERQESTSAKRTKERRMRGT